MRSMSLVLVADTQQLQADLALLAQAAELSSEVRQRLLDLGDLSSQVRCVDVHSSVAPLAGELRVRLELGDGLAELLAAVRAGYFDAL